MFKKYLVMGFLTLSLSAVANNMSAQPQKDGFSLKTDSTGSRQRYEKQSRVSYAAADTPAEPTAPESTAATQSTPPVAKPATEPVAEPAAQSSQKAANTTRPNKQSKRSGGMRY